MLVKPFSPHIIAHITLPASSCDAPGEQKEIATILQMS